MRFPWRLPFIALAIFLAGSPEAWPKEIDLFTRSSHPELEDWTDFAPDYDRILRSLEPGDIVKFTDGSRFVFEKKLGRGSTTCILAVREVGGKVQTSEMLALRVPVTSRPIRTGLGFGAPAERFLDQTVRGYPELMQAGVPVPRLMRHLKDQYVLAELIPNDFNGLDFFRHPEKIGPETLKQAEDALMAFAVRTADFESIGDFRPDQIVYSETKKQWYLLDWTGRHIRRTPLSMTKSPTIFGDTFARNLKEARVSPGLVFRRNLSAREVALLQRLRKTVARSRSYFPGVKCYYSRLKAVLGI